MGVVAGVVSGAAVGSTGKEGGGIATAIGDGVATIASLVGASTGVDVVCGTVSLISGSWAGGYGAADVEPRSYRGSGLW